MKKRSTANRSARSLDQTAAGLAWTTSAAEAKRVLYERLQACTLKLENGKSLAATESTWLASMLNIVLSGDDVRGEFLDKPARGRPSFKLREAVEFWITVDAMIESEETGKVGKVLWGEIAVRWGRKDGSIKNIIARQRKNVEAECATVSNQHLKPVVEEWRKKLTEFG
jgi:hypothetical protein